MENKNKENEKKGLFARLFESFDKKMAEQAKSGCCCCSSASSKDKDKSSCC